LQLTGNDFEQGGLAGTVDADQRDLVPIANFKRDADFSWLSASRPSRRSRLHKEPS